LSRLFAKLEFRGFLKNLKNEHELVENEEDMQQSLF